MLPVLLCTPERFLSVKAVFSIIISPNTKIWGSTNITKKIDIIVPRPRHCPIDETAGSDESLPISTPADANIEPDVNIVGNA